MKYSRKIEVLKMIAADMKNDAKNFDGRPFNGRTVAEYFGNHGAAIATLANIVQSILEQKEKEMTPIQACKETKELWTMMARVSVKEKRTVEKSQIPGPWTFYRHNCPCCEYAKWHPCDCCPMYEEWLFYSSNLDGTCEGVDSPYNKWRNSSHRTQTLCIDVEFFCLLIAEMAEEAIERLEKD